MFRIRLTRANFPDAYWLRYRNEDGIIKHVSLSSCANNFRLTEENEISSDEQLRCVGWRYEDNGCLCYELFCVGHLVLFTSLRPGVVDQICGLLSRKKAEDIRRETALNFENALNQSGWKTLEKALTEGKEHGFTEL